MDFSRLSQELVHAVRGRRSQSALSRRLGFKSNVLYAWEHGHRAPTAQQFFAIAERTGQPAIEALRGFYRQRPAWLRGKVVDREIITELLEHERGKVPVVQVARDTGMSRFSLARYFRGDVDVRLPEFLCLLDATSHRLLDFIALWTDPAQLPSASERWQEQQAARDAAYDRPWSHAVLRSLETEKYRRAPRHSVALISRLIGTSQAEVKRCLRLLERGRQVRWTGCHYQPVYDRSLDLGVDVAASRSLSAWWLDVAAQRARHAQRGMFAYNVCSVSQADLQEIAALQKECLRQIRAIVARSEPTERVALIGVQVMALEDTQTDASSERRHRPAH